MADLLFKYEVIAQHLAQFPGGLTRAEIARLYGISKQTAVSHLENCLAKGLVERYVGYGPGGRLTYYYCVPGDGHRFETDWWTVAHSPIEQRMLEGVHER